MCELKSGFKKTVRKRMGEKEIVGWWGTYEVLLWEERKREAKEEDMGGVGMRVWDSHKNLLHQSYEITCLARLDFRWILRQYERKPSHPSQEGTHSTPFITSTRSRILNRSFLYASVFTYAEDRLKKTDISMIYAIDTLLYVRQVKRFARISASIHDFYDTERLLVALRRYK